MDVAKQHTKDKWVCNRKQFNACLFAMISLSQYVSVKGSFTFLMQLHLNAVDTLSREANQSILFEKGSTLKGARKEFAPLGNKFKGSKFFPFGIDPFSEEGSTLKGKNLLPLGANSFLLE